MVKPKRKGSGGKYAAWITAEGLIKIEGWARDGLTDEQIAQNIGVARQTLYEWIKRFPVLSETLKRGKEVIDRQVENALLKRALGYEYIERKYDQCRMSEEEYYLNQQIAVNRYKLENPEATIEEINLVKISVSKFKRILVEERSKEVAADVTAGIFWLKNRKPNEWRDKRQVEHSGGVKIENPLENLTTDELRKLIDK